MCCILADVLIVGGIIGCAQFADDAIAVEEHFLATLYMRHIPSATHADGGERGAFVEHVVHVGHLGRVEAAQVQFDQRTAAVEHSLHVVHIGGIEAVQIQVDQRAAAGEHLNHTGHIRRVEAAQVQFDQRAATIEHFFHFCHLRCVEVAQVKVRQFFAVVEHLIHIRHLAGVQVLQIRDGGQLIHTRKPTVGGSGAGRGHRGIEHHRCDAGGISAPVGRVARRVHRIGSLGVLQALAVGIERQRLAVGGEHRVGAALVRQVAGIGIAAVNTGIRLVTIVDVIGRALAAHEFGAGSKHVVAACHERRAPATAYHDGFQRATFVEHIPHIGHFGRIETAQVEGCHDIATLEHGVHGRHIMRVEATHVDAGQKSAITEHRAHVRHVRCVKAAHIALGQLEA